MKPTIELLIGSPLVGSEAVFLRQLCSDLSTSGQFLILANFEVRQQATSRQVDFVVVGAQRAELVELKALSGPVVGGENGPWKIVDFSGKTIDYEGENPWNQARNAKLVLNDAMLRYQRERVGVPKPRYGRFFEFDASVCIYPSLDPRSKVTHGNYKAWVRSYPSLISALISRPLPVPATWGFDDWRRFAIDYLGLVPSSLESATDASFAKADQTVKSYEANLHHSLSEGLGELLRNSSNTEICGEVLIQTLLCPNNCLIVGQSGLGKTHHLKHLAIRTIGSSEVPLLIDARHYKGDFGRAIAKAISPCTVVQATVLLDSVRTVGRSPLLVVDGLNYCSPEQFEDLARDLQGFQLRFQARIVASSQFEPDLPGSLAFRVFALGPLGIEHKRQIFRFHAGETGANTQCSLDGISTAYGLKVAGRTCRVSPPETTATLYDNYVAQLSPHGFASTSAAFFRHCATAMDEQVCYFLERDLFERLLETFVDHGQISLAFMDKLHECPLLVFSGDVVHFEHDLLRDYFVGETLRRKFTTHLQLAEELKRPKYHGVIQFICARLRSASEVEQALRSAGTAVVIRDASQGHCGRLAQDVVKKGVQDLFFAAATDLANLSLSYQVFERENKRYATWPSLLGNRSWSKYEEILCAAAAEYLDDADLAPGFLDLLDLTEWTLRRLAESEAKSLAAGPRGAWAELLRCIFILQPQELTIPLLRMLSLIRSDTGEKSQLNDLVISGLFSRVDTSDFALLTLLGYSGRSSNLDVDACIRLFGIAVQRKLNCFLTEALHMMRFRAGQISREHPDRVSEIASMLENLPSQDLLTNSILVDVLAAYDAIEPAVTFDEALEELKSVVEPNHPAIEDRAKLEQRAYRLIGNLFEDGFGNVYDDAYRALSHAEKVSLLSLAAIGSQNGFFTDWILQELLSLRDPDSLRIFQHFVRDISAESSSPQETVAAFVLSIAGCAMFQAELPELDSLTATPDRLAWTLVGKIIYFVLAGEHLERSEQLALIWQRIT